MCHHVRELSSEQKNSNFVMIAMINRAASMKEAGSHLGLVSDAFSGAGKGQGSQRA